MLIERPEKASFCFCQVLKKVLCLLSNGTGSDVVISLVIGLERWRIIFMLWRMAVKSLLLSFSIWRLTTKLHLKPTSRPSKRELHNLFAELLNLSWSISRNLPPFRWTRCFYVYIDVNMDYASSKRVSGKVINFQTTQHKDERWKRRFLILKIILFAFNVEKAWVYKAYFAKVTSPGKICQTCWGHRQL